MKTWTNDSADKGQGPGEMAVLAQDLGLVPAPTLCLTVHRYTQGTHICVGKTLRHIK